MKKELKEMSQKETYLQHTLYTDFLSRKRLNLIMEQVIAYTQEKQASQLKVLDMGCGIGGMTFPLSALGYQVVGVDLDPESISVCNEKNTFPNARYVVGNGETLDLGEKFDVIISSEVLEHSPHPDLLLQTIGRHLADEGIGIVTVPNGYCPYELVFSRLFQKIGILSLFHKLPKRVYTSLTGSPTPYHSMNIFCNHVQFFSFGKFKRLLNNCGFRILNVRHLSLGLLLDWKWLSYLKRIECKVADYVPHFLAGGWVFVIKTERKRRVIPNDLRVSIIIPTYNRPDSLSLCLSSLEEQTVTPHEVIIVVDGGITDEVQKVMDTFRYRSKLHIIQINNRERKGAQVSRSIGLQAASGEIISYLDDDITLEPDWLAQILKGYRDNKDAAGVGGIIIDPTPFMDNALYKLFAKIRAYLFRRKMGKVNFIGLPYAYLTAPSDKYLSVDFLNSGNSSYRRQILTSHGPDKVMDLDYVEEHNLGTILTRKEKRKLIYNSKAVAYHHSSRSGGSWVGDRMYYVLRDHTTYLLKNFNLRYPRLALFSIYVLALSILYRKPKYLKAISEGVKQYHNWITQEAKIG